MYSSIRSSLRRRILTSRLGSVLLLFQRSPLVQMLFPEARILGGAGLAEITQWSVATIVGLGAFDSVAGATVISQISPSLNATAVPASYGSSLTFVVQCTGAPSKPASWTISGTLPTGLVHSNAQNSSTDAISGTPTQTGSFPVVVTAWRYPNGTGSSISQSFTINVSVGTQTLTFGALTAKTFGTAPSTLTATASSGLTVSYASSNPAVATISGSNLTLVGAGTTTITASQPGNTNYSAATPISQTLSVVASDSFTTWQNALFSPAQLADPLVSSATADPDGDGISNVSEYIFGLLPFKSEPSPSPALGLALNQVSLNFTAKAANGSGYAGKTRHYALESSSTLDPSGPTSWTSLSNYTDILGSDQAVSYAVTATSPKTFYRLRVWLTP